MTRSALCAVLLIGCASKTPSEGDSMSSRKSETPSISDAAQARQGPDRRGARDGERIAPLAPVRGPGRLAFAGDRLAQLVGDGVVVWRSDTLASSSEIALSEPQGLAALADGTLVVLHAPSDGRQLCRIAPKQTTIGDCHPVEIGEPGRLTFVGEGAAPDEVWLRAPTNGQPLRRWRLRTGGGPLELVQTVPVIDKAYDTLVALGDGPCAYTDGYNLYRVGPAASAPERFEGTTQAIGLIARAHEPGTAWIAGEELGLRLVRLADPFKGIVDLPPIAKIQPIALAGDGSRVAALWANVQDLRNPAFTLRVHRGDGKVAFETAPPWQPKTRAEALLVSLALAGDRLAMGSTPASPSGMCPAAACCWTRNSLTESSRADRSRTAAGGDDPRPRSEEHALHGLVGRERLAKPREGLLGRRRIQAGEERAGHLHVSYDVVRRRDVRAVIDRLGHID